MATGYHIGQHRYNTILSSENILWQHHKVPTLVTQISPSFIQIAVYTVPAIFSLDCVSKDSHANEQLMLLHAVLYKVCS